MSPVDPAKLPLRVAERAGRLLFWVMQQDLPRREREVALWFISDGDTYLDTIASHRTIGQALGVSDRTVRDALAGLEERGMLERRQRTNVDGTRTSDHTRLVVPLELLRLRSNEQERAQLGHEGEIDLREFAISGAEITSAPGTPTNRMTAGPEDSSLPGAEISSEPGAEESSVEPLSTQEVSVSGRSEGYPEEVSAPLLGRRRRTGRGPTVASEIFSPRPAT